MHIWLRCTARLAALSLLVAPTAVSQGLRVASPDGRTQVSVAIRDGGLYYGIDRDGRALFLPSRLGLAFRGMPPLTDSLRIVDSARSTHDETWTQAMGEVAQVRDHHNELRVALAPFADGTKVYGRTPFVTPWRTIQLADRATDLAPSVLGLNLNPPSVIPNTSWIKPMKYVGIWWGMHIGTMTWSSGPKHGATTANTKRYIDFAAANGLGGVLVEGWNVGWDGDWIQNRNAFSFTKPYPDYDLAEVARYAHQKGVKLIVHNETSGGLENYERQMDSARSEEHTSELQSH